MTTSSNVGIDLRDGADGDELTNLLFMQESTRKHITTIRIYSSKDAEECIGNATLTNLFRCLGEHANLELLRINLGGGKLRASLLAHVINQTPKLLMLCLQSVVLTTNDDSNEKHKDGFQALTNAVQDHPSLTWVELNSIYVGSKVRYSFSYNADNTALYQAAAPLQTLLVSLALECPNMLVLQLEEVPVSSSAMKAMASSAHLHQLDFCDVPNFNDHCADLVHVLQTSKASVLQKLKIRACRLGTRAAQGLVTMLQHNNTLLSVELKWDFGANVLFARPIAAILKNNQTLTSLYLICHQEDPLCSSMSSTTNGRSAVEAPLGCYPVEAYADMICHQGLAYNTRLERFRLEFRQSRRYRNDNSRLAKAFGPPLGQVLQTKNLRLQEFSLMGGTSVTPIVWTDDISFSLRLNQGGLRQRWLKHDKNASAGTGSSHEEMMQTLINHQHVDLSMLFYLLSVHPHLLLARPNTATRGLPP